jgi:PAS domain-containing protein
MINEKLRLLAVKKFEAVDLQADGELQEIVAMASEICSTQVALITLLDENTQRIKVRLGSTVESCPREISFCKVAIEQDDILLVPDTMADERFFDNPLVTGEPNLRFYAGAPLITADGHRLGTLCVVDERPHTLDKHQQLMLKMLSKQAISIMELKVSKELLRKKQQEAEESKKAIATAEIRLRSFFENSAHLHVLLGKGGEVIDYNKTAYNFIRTVHGTKLSRGCQFIEFLEKSTVIPFVENYAVALKGKKAEMEGITYYENLGDIYWEASFDPAWDNEDNIIGISYVVRNITERKLHEKRIMAQNESLIQIAYIQSHEYRGPLASILGLMNLIKEEGYEPPTEYLKMLETAVHRLDEKIHEVVSIVNNPVH